MKGQKGLISKFMNRKYIGVGIIILGLIILGIIIYVIFIYDFSPEEVAPEEKAVVETKQDINKIATTTVTSIPKTYKASQPKTTAGEEDIKQIAASFAERFGSYSNQSDFSNIEDLKLFMSRRMRNWADDYVKELRVKSGKSDIYYGITTKAVSVETKSFEASSGRAQILVKTQRREATGTTNNASNKYADILISFIKENGAWKVDEARWEDMPTNL